MPEVGDFGERAATEDEVEDWIALVRAGQTATRGYRARNRADHRRDAMRPSDGASEPE